MVGSGLNNSVCFDKYTGFVNSEVGDCLPCFFLYYDGLACNSGSVEIQCG